jgi:hypothetical protein
MRRKMVLNINAGILGNSIDDVVHLELGWIKKSKNELKSGGFYGM